VKWFVGVRKSSSVMSMIEPVVQYESEILSFFGTEMRYMGCKSCEGQASESAKAQFEVEGA
jgi:hypothetical protein